MKQFFLFLVILGSAFSANAQSATTSTGMSPEGLIQKQVDAYNAHDLDAFLATYADDVELYDLPDKLISKGKDAMRADYKNFFTKSPLLHCEVAKRIVLNNTIIDHEKVTIDPKKPPFQSIAIYKVENGLIKKVYFTQ